MAEYYLISQLPSLDGIADGAPVPITEESFLELCGRFLGKKAFSMLEDLTLLPPENAQSTTCGLIDSWNEGERNLRLALAKVRAEKMNKPFDLQNKVLSAELLKIVNAAVEIGNPLEAENFLLQYRLNFLETLRPMDSFSESFLFYYGLKLKLISRIRQFDAALGEATYKEIYNSIINSNRVEA